MAASRRTRLLLGLAGLGLAAVAVDRFLLAGPPATAAAAPAHANPSEAQREPTPGAALRDAIAAEAAARAPDIASLPELFAPEGLATSAPSAAINTDPLAAAPAGPALTRGATGLELTAVVDDPAGGAAVINGRVVRLGRDTAGYTLIAVGARSAILRRGQNLHLLTLATAEPAGRDG